MISELDARKIGYEDSMSNRELSELLGQVNAKEEAEEKDAKKTAERKPEDPAATLTGKPTPPEKGAEPVKEKPEEPLNIDYTGIRCGVSTIQDIHRRVCIIEHKLGL